MTKKKMTITGDNVQGVVYRLFLLDNAERMLITHLDARNIKKHLDQEIIEKVEVLIGGDEHRVSKFVDFVKNNFPEHANVDIPLGDAEDYDGDIRTIESFSRCLSVHQLVKFANIGTAIVAGVKELKIETNDNFGKMDKKYEAISKGMFLLADKIDKRMEELEERNKLVDARIDERNKIADMRMEKTEKSIEELLRFLIENK